MAASILPMPGTEYGPCAVACFHTDCAHTRRMAAMNCPFCNEPIGYERRSYDEGEPGVLDLVHAVCLEDHLESGPPDTGPR